MVWSIYDDINEWIQNKNIFIALRISVHGRTNILMF